MAEPPPAHELTGIIHCHSTYSDGTGTVPEIAAAARANDLDYLLLTDHDTLAAAQHGEEGGTARCCCWPAARCRPIGATTISPSG